MEENNLLHLIHKGENFEQHLTINLAGVKEYWFYNSFNDDNHKLIITYLDGSERVFTRSSAKEIFNSLGTRYKPNPLEIDGKITSIRG